MLRAYELDLVLLSVIVAIMSSYTALDLAGHVTRSAGRVARVWLLGGAIAMGAGIWAMHFIGMLAFSLPIRLAYDLPITLASLLIAIVFSGFALLSVSAPTLTTRKLLTGGAVMGAGICAMHYTGMAAMRMDPPIHYDPLLFAASLLIAIGAAIVALFLSFTLRAYDRRRVVRLRLLGAVVMGLAISGMHYTGMMAAHFAPGALCLAKNSLNLGNVALGYVIGSAILSLLTATLIASLFDARMASLAAHFAAIVKNSDDAIISKDLDGIITTWNRAAERMFGYTAREAIGQPIQMLMPGDRADEEARMIERILHGQDIEHYETVRCRKDGALLDISLTVSPIIDAHGQIVGASNIARDITASKRAELELIEAKAAAERANRAKSTFLSSMSHELRTPLHAILGFAQMVESGTPPPTPLQKRNLEHILKAGWYLQELINEILDLALIESGKLALAVEPVSLSEVLLECRALIEPEAGKRGISLTFPHFDIPCFVHADRTRLKQVLVNLLFNAVKYNSPAGSLIVDFSLSPPDSMRIGVRDTGAGLTSEQLAQLFQPFNRIGKENSSEEGTGIGLVMTKRLVELMGGSIGADSTVGTGSEFWIELGLAAAPPAVVDAEPEARPPSKALEGTALRTVLYVEDNPANLELVEQLLARRTDLRLLSATDARSGIELALAHQPAVILMDINLPAISGREALKILRASPVTTNIPVVAVSANAMPRDIEDGLAAGFFDYIAKPIKVNVFMATLEVALAFSQTAADRASAPVTEKVQP